MFQTKTPVAVLAGMAVAGSILLAPVVVAAPTGGVAVTWGANGWGQLGDNSTTYSKVPVVVDRSGVLAGKTVTAISAGDRRTCAVAARRAYCWGGNDLRELGLTVSVVPVAVDASGVLAGKTVTAITAGDYYTCAVADGQTFCWGRNKQQRRDEVEGAGSGEHRRAAAPYIGHRDRRRRRPHGSHRSADDFGSAAAHCGDGIKAAVKKRPVKITWKPVTAATSYRVRISKPGGKKSKPWKTTSTRVFKTKARKGKKYRFQVAAVGVGGRGPATTKRFKAK